MGNAATQMRRQTQRVKIIFERAFLSLFTCVFTKYYFTKHKKYKYLAVTNKVAFLYNWECSNRNQFTPLRSSLINNWPKYFPTLRSASDYSKEANVVTEFSGLNSKMGRLTYILHVKIAWSRSTRFNLKFPVLNSKFWFLTLYPLNQI